MDINGIKEFVIGMALVALIAGAGAIALSAFQSDTKLQYITSVSNATITLTSHIGSLPPTSMYISTSECRNSSTSNILTLNVECNVSGGVVTTSGVNTSNRVQVDYTHYTPTSMYNISDNGLTAIDNTTSYFGTAGTIAGVALLLGIVIGAFYFVAAKGKAQA